jgi:antitoxin component YwqK of YwqJK toxin-antitoxin module
MYIRIFIRLILAFVLIPLALEAQNDTLFNQTDANHMKQGYWKKTYPNGKHMYKGFFKDDKPVGEMYRYYESGGLKAILHYDDKSEYACARLFYEDGQLAARGLYYKSLKDSVWEYYSYYDHSLAARETYSKGERNGLMTLYYNNGNISERLEWKNNRKDGIWEQYFADNTPKLKGHYRESQLEGDFLVNYDNGKPYLQGNYQNNLRNGTWTFYSPEGKIEMQLQYQHGKTLDEDKLDERQQEMFRMIDENQGKFNEPDETDFLMPQGR